MATTSTQRAQRESLLGRRTAPAPTSRQLAHADALRRYLQLHAPSAARPVLRHEERVINGHTVEVTEDDVGVVELHEE